MRVVPEKWRVTRSWRRSIRFLRLARTMCSGLNLWANIESIRTEIPGQLSLSWLFDKRISLELRDSLSSSFLTIKSRVKRTESQIRSPEKVGSRQLLAIDRERKGTTSSCCCRQGKLERSRLCKTFCVNDVAIIKTNMVAFFKNSVQARTGTLVYHQRKRGSHVTNGYRAPQRIETQLRNKETHCVSLIRVHNSPNDGQTRLFFFFRLSSRGAYNPYPITKTNKLKRGRLLLLVVIGVGDFTSGRRPPKTTLLTATCFVIRLIRRQISMPCEQNKWWK